MARSNSASSTGWWIALGVVIALAAAGFHAVLSARFDAGEAYPAYSTLRADPLGARAIFEALGRLPKLESIRSFELMDRHEGKPGETLFLLNVSSNIFNNEGDDLDGKQVEKWAVNGSRVVITINSKIKAAYLERVFNDAEREVEKEQKAKDDSAKKDKGTPEKSDVKKDGGTRHKESKSSLAEALQVKLDEREFTLTDKGGMILDPAKDAPLSPSDVPLWFSNVSLSEHTDADKKSADKPSGKSPWRTIAHRGDRAMIMERRLGAGSVVICTDSFFASNEALWNDPKTRFIAWLVGDSRRVVFEETHLGSSIGDEDSLMTLARRYGMHGLFVGGLLLFTLYVWRNGASLVPPDESRDLGHWRADAIAGMSAASGMESLLTRGIPRGQILHRCFETWDGTAAASGPVPAVRRAHARAELARPVDLKDVPALYQKLRDIIHPPRK